MTTAFALFYTAIGRCGLAWRGDRIIALALPGETDERTLARLLRRCPDAVETPPEGVAAQAVAAIQGLLSGQPADLASIPIDLDAVPAFDRSVYQALRSIPPGTTITYGVLAEQAGASGAARAVGAAMGRNPIPIIIPCHRVLASSGRSGGFSAPGGVATKLRILRIEQARRGSEPLLFGDLPLAVRMDVQSSSSRT